MHIHILGICGTFMGSLAQLAKAMGHRVSGSDTGVYPPMSTQLRAAGIDLIEGYDPAQLQPAPDLVVVGNALSRGNPAVEFMLDRGLAYTSGPQWLCEHLLSDKWVLAVAGTHGKTTTSSMLAWILEFAGLSPGYLIGGVPKNFTASARLGESSFFVVEADEYDSAFFDKRSKFVHYRPRTVILNNLEYDHADIFPDLAAIQRQFHHLVRIVPGNGRIICPEGDPALEEVLRQGCWTPVEKLALECSSEAEDGPPTAESSSPTAEGSSPIAEGSEATKPKWAARLCRDDGSRFVLLLDGEARGEVAWTQTGLHNVRNALAAVAAARHVGVEPETAVAALNGFAGVKRRMECIGNSGGVSIYDDFAHHPTAIATTLSGLRKKVGAETIIALIEPRSNTMRMGRHKEALGTACASADAVIWYQPPGVDWAMGDVVDQSPVPATLVSDIDTMIEDTLALAGPGSHIVIMSNGGFGGIHQRLLERLQGQNRDV